LLVPLFAGNVTVDVGEVGKAIDTPAFAGTTVHVPVPTVGALPAKVTVVPVQTVWSLPAAAGVG
jgi:hypothetical protein